MPSLNEACSSLGQAVLQYDTLKVVHIRSKKVGLINRLIQLIIIGYVIGYVIIYTKGYQDTDLVSGVAVMKLKGVAYTQGENAHVPRLNTRLWDMVDYHIPPQESNAFFVMTNLIQTPNQKMGLCGENPSSGNPNVNCSNPATVCQANTKSENGIMTGNCIPYNNTAGQTNEQSCEIFSWCPVEDDRLINGMPALLAEDAKEFTAFVKNSIEFRKFNVKERNIPDEINNREFLQQCRFHPINNASCPIFKLFDIFTFVYGEKAEENWQEATKTGAVMAIDIVWNCNLDTLGYSCKPKYEFRRVDNPDVQLSKGYNFRFANYFERDIDGLPILHRNMTKAMGLLFQVNVKGEAGKFSVVPLFVNLGSGLALLSVATIMCDFITLNFLKRREIYREKKFEEVEVEEDFVTLVNHEKQPSDYE